MTSAPVTTEQLFATRCVYGLLGDPDYAAEAASLRASAPFADLDPAEVGELLLRFGTSDLSRATSPFMLKWIDSNPKPSHEILAASLDAFQAWPHGFYATLSKIGSRYGLVDRQRVRGFIKAFEIWLDKRRTEGRGVALANAIDVYRRGCTTVPIEPPFVDLLTH